jgi:manganese/zinc/iron transport system substrate-binding protein
VRRAAPALTICFALALAVVAAGCTAGAGTGAGFAGDGEKLRVATTTNFITDSVAEVGGDRVEVVGLMGPGVDPHLYRASAGDVETLRDADVVFYGGLLLEAKLEEVLEGIGESRPAVAVTRDIPRRLLLEPPEGSPAEEEYDPHVWFDVALWARAVETIRETLSEADPEGAAEYARNARRYRAELDALDRRTREMLAGIPARRRVLVTSHDAFRYLGRAYGVEVAAIQGISTADEATTRDIERIAELIARRGVRAVFVESSVPPQTIQAVLAAAERRGGRARIGGELFSDAAGDPGTPEGTYVGMVEANVEHLVEGLR